MHRSILAVALLISAPSIAAEIVTVDHDLEVRLNAARHRVEVVDRVAIPEGSPKVPRFVLHAGMAPEVLDDGVELLELSGAPDPAWFGIDPAESPFGDEVPLTLYELRARDGAPVREVTLRYGGAIHHPLQEEGEDYARSFQETPGTIQAEGAYLAGSTFWVPWFGPSMVTFTMEVRPGTGWDALSAGTRASHQDLPGGVRVRWDSTDPLDEVHLVAGPFTIYEDTAGPVAIYAYLRTADDALARKYLDTTSQYLRMYADLIGPYPYTKFALVENFWETGYGMPSFTLLGPKIIRFPFILHSSYPHEILHNWWGNGVFVDAARGNWCEGLTAYLADHLIKEQRGQGSEYRRDLLQKYADYVRDGNDIPLTEFRQRHSSATQAVGYGKTAMVFHMLRRRFGDDAFVASLRSFYKNNRFRRASWSDVRTAFETVTGEDLESFFDAWVTRAGAPSVRINHVGAATGRAEVVLAQDADGAPYPLQLPVAVTVDGHPDAVQSEVDLAGPAAAAIVPVEGAPVRVQVDPDFDVFRRLDRAEIPPSLGQVFGAPKVVIVLPSAAEGELADSFRALAENWSSNQAGDVEVVHDKKLKALPGDAAVWLFGWDNRFREKLAPALEARGAMLTERKLHAADRTLARGEHDAVAVAPHPDNADLAVAFLGTSNPAAVPGLGRKLPHYGKYGFLGFEGDAPDNVLKGQWEAVGSPMDRSLVEGASPAAGERRSRDALATLPPLFSAQRMLDDAAKLADPALRGRGCGEPGLALAADLLEARFRELGLRPGVGDGYRQPFAARCGEDGRTAELVNIVGVLPGTDAGWADQSVVVVAHYDHLGTGWPDAREGHAGKIHPGADDNASGVAVLLELARVLRESLEPRRAVVFLATSGEESGLQGAKHYVAAPGARPASKTIGALNLDTVGRLEEGKVLVLGAGSASEWVHIVRGAGYVTGVPSQAVMDDLGSSDHKAFLDAGVPAVQFFTGPHLDYHRPTDTPEKLDGEGMVRVATFVKEFVEYLASREDPMTSKLAGAAPAAASRGGSGRRVSLGSVPDFEFAGHGYRLGGVVPGSPAEAAGLQEGDVIVRIEDIAIEGLRDVSNALKGHDPGDRVDVTYVRDGSESTVTVELVAR